MPRSVEFKSFAPLLTNTKGKALGEEYIYGAYKDQIRIIRDNQYKLLLYTKLNKDKKHSRKAKLQLFDLQKDPYETNNLMDQHDERYKQIAQKLFSKLVKKQKEMDDYLILNKSDYNL